MKRLLPAILSGCLACTSAAWGEDDIKPFEDDSQTRRLDPEESRIWEQSAEAYDLFRKAGQLNEDPELVAYLQGIAHRLFPEFEGRLHLHVVRSTSFNAFAMPEGGLFINEGVIAHTDNEAQLATIIAHEGAHFTHRHGYRHKQEILGASGFALVVAMLGVPLVGDLVALSSIAGYSRDTEREADRGGFDRLVRAGYDPREAVRSFENMARYVEASGGKEPYFFASHPRLLERIESFQALAADKNGGTVNEADHLRRTAAVRLDVLREELARGRHRNVLLLLAPENRGKYPPEADYYLAEAYRLRGRDGDAQRAFAAYSSATARAPGFAPPHRALGVHYLKQANYRQAQACFENYLRLAPQAMDRGYVEQYLAIAQTKAASQ